MAMQKGAILILVGLFAAGCGVTQRGTIPWEDENTSSPSPSPPPANSASTVTVEESSSPKIQEMQEFLQLAYKDWKGIPYLLGGTGYNGIDCSAFMQVVFEDYFLRKVPRTTLEQLQMGKNVRKSSIRTGDLVFFKTGNRTYHVGVMINKSEFLHASTSEGVTISKLDHPFWKETYFTTRRIL